MEFKQMLAEAQKLAGNLGLDSMTWIEREKYIAELSNKRPGNLTGYDCPDCMNRGYFSRVDDRGYRFSDECHCMAIRRSLKAMEKSGMKDLLDRYSFDNWQTPEKWQKSLKERALQYVAEKKGWFVTAGSVGAGKTHICTAVCGRLLMEGVRVKYGVWRDISVRAKAAIQDGEYYESIMEPLKRTKALYIDDFLKTPQGKVPTAGDLNLAFEVLNARYNDENLLTILSSEWGIEEMIDFDEALGSRIYQRARNYYFPLKNCKNWRIMT